MREDAFEGGTDDVWRVRGGRTTMKLVPAVITDT